MSTDEYVPSDEDMAHWFEGEEDPEHGRALWDRWLAAHDARVAREALDGLAKAELDHVAHMGKHSYPAHIAQGIATAAWNYKWKTYGGAHPEETP